MDRLSSSDTFTLVCDGTSTFSMIIRLAPGMVEEIQCVEAQGGRTRVKFVSNPNHDENIIDVGGKQFRFTWSQEFGELCDIYEERQSGEEGNGLLVESGCAWRKLNVQRTLDESTKNHIKMRSKEAERKHKSRKAIVLEPGNPTLKALAAAEAAPRKNYNKKKEALPPKNKVETLQVGGTPKSTYKPGLSSTTPTMSTGKHFSSFSSPPDQTIASSSPLGAISISKGIDDVGPSQKILKQDTNIGSEKEILTRANIAMRNTRESKEKNIVEPMDLHSILIHLLTNKPDGMTLKALEKAVKGIVPSPKKNIKSIVRKIASYKSPGRYILLPRVDLESFKKPLTENGSDDNHPQLPDHQEFHDEASTPHGGSKENDTNDALEELEKLKSKVAELTKALENFSVQHASPDILGEKKGSGLREGQGGISIDDRGSDSDSDNNDSGSHSRIRSSPVGRGSGSSSDSENGASSKSKECPHEDENAEIVTSYDEKESNYKTEASNKMVSSLIRVKSPDGRSLQYQTHEKQDHNESDAVETEKNLAKEHESEMALTTAAILKDSSRHEHFDNYERLSKGKHKRHSAKNIYGRRVFIKRSKTEYVGQARVSLGTDVQMFKATRSFSPMGITEGSFKNLSIQAMNRADKIGNSNFGLQMGYNQTFRGRSATDLTQKDFHPCEGSSMLNDKSHRVAQNEDIRAISEKVSGNARDDKNGSKHSLSLNSHCVKQGETIGKLSEGRTSTHYVLCESNPDEYLVTKLLEQKSSLEVTSESRNSSLAFVSYGFSANYESKNKKIVDILFEESTRSHSKTMHSDPQHPKAFNVEIVSHKNLAEMSGGPISNEFGVTQGIDFNSLEEEAGRGEGAEFTDKNNRDQNSREYFFGENSSYLKYEKSEAELKGPITSFSQYQEYVQEFHEKHDSYMFLNKACVSYRDEFQALCDASKDAKDDVDKYNSIMGKLKESYETYGTKHIRQKKIYVILHKELESIKQRITEFVEAQNKE